MSVAFCSVVAPLSYTIKWPIFVGHSDRDGPLSSMGGRNAPLRRKNGISSSSSSSVSTDTVDLAPTRWPQRLPICQQRRHARITLWLMAVL